MTRASQRTDHPATGMALLGALQGGTLLPLAPSASQPRPQVRLYGTLS